MSSVAIATELMEVAQPNTATVRQQTGIPQWFMETHFVLSTAKNEALCPRDTDYGQSIIHGREQNSLVQTSLTAT
jgi:hypothetical protein